MDVYLYTGCVPPNKSHPACTRGLYTHGHSKLTDFFIGWSKAGGENPFTAFRRNAPCSTAFYKGKTLISLWFAIPKLQPESMDDFSNDYIEERYYYTDFIERNSGRSTRAFHKVSLYTRSSCSPHVMNFIQVWLHNTGHTFVSMGSIFLF